MIGTITSLRSAGFRIDRGVQDEVLQRCLRYAEVYLLREMIGVQALTEAQALASTDPLIAGSDTFEGLRRGIEYLAVSHLLMDDVFASTFGTVRKNDENSTNPDPWEVAKRYETIGRTIVRQYADLVGCEFDCRATMLTEFI